MEPSMSKSTVTLFPKMAAMLKQLEEKLTLAITVFSGKRGIRKKRILITCLLASACLFAFEEVNILRNTNFEVMEGDYLPYWSTGPLGCVQTGDFLNVLPGEAPDGGNALRMTFDGRLETFRQLKIKLVAGERYRFGAFVRTSGLETPIANLRVWNAGWQGEISSNIQLPRDTHGEWVRVEGEGVLPDSNKNIFPYGGAYTYGLYAKLAKGQVDFACPYLIPLSEAAMAGSRVPDFKGRAFYRIVPVRPLLWKIPENDQRMTFFIPGIPEQTDAALANYECAIQVRMADDDDFSEWRRAPLDASKTAVIDLGYLPPGEGMLRAALVPKGKTTPLFQNEYAIRVIPPLPQVTLKRRNNMVADILETDLRDGETTFVNPRDGWVFIGFDKPCPGTTATLDNDSEPVLLHRDGEPSDTMRLLAAGTHTLRIANTPASGGRLSIRTVPQLMLYALDIAPKLVIADFRYDLPFFKRHLLHSVNVFGTENWTPTSNYHLSIDRELASRGMKILGSEHLIFTDDIDGFVEKIRNNPSLKRNWGVNLDEMLITDPGALTGISEMLWHLVTQEKRVNVWSCGIMSEKTFLPNFQQNMLSATSNVSRSEGKLFLETYIGTKRTEAELDKELEKYATHLELSRRMTPDAATRFMMVMSGYTTPEDWCINNYPSADIKVAFDRFFRLLATDPRMDGLYGTGCYSIFHCDEELVRWIGRLIRHYCVDGNTDSLAEKFGFAYLPGHLLDGDFEEGFTRWEASPAEHESLVVKNIPGFAVEVQHRHTTAGECDNVALFTRSAEKPNRLMQTATRLVPGRLYCLSFVVVDYDKLLDRKRPAQKAVLDATITNAEILPDVTSMRVWPRTGVSKNIRRIVFRAQKETATITFSDWTSADEPGGPVGARQTLNWVGLRPYYAEAETP